MAKRVDQARGMRIPLQKAYRVDPDLQRIANHNDRALLVASFNSVVWNKLAARDHARSLARATGVLRGKLFIRACIPVIACLVVAESHTK